MAVEDGLLVPVVHGADHLGLGEIAARRATLVERAQTGKFAPEDLSGGTFTISNLGMYGVEKFSAIVNPPQAAILGVGKIEERAVVRDGELAVGSFMVATLAADHRILYGADVAQFLSRVRLVLEDPVRLAL